MEEKNITETNLVGYDVYVANRDYEVCCLNCYDSELDNKITPAKCIRDDVRFWEEVKCFFCNHDLKCAVSRKYTCDECDKALEW